MFGMPLAASTAPAPRCSREHVAHASPGTFASWLARAQSKRAARDLVAD